jgi:carbonic anhydrase
LIRQRELSQRAIGENVRFVVNQLAENSEILRKRVQPRKLLIVGAEYSLESGNLTFFS